MRLGTECAQSIYVIVDIIAALFQCLGRLLFCDNHLVSSGLLHP